MSPLHNISIERSVLSALVFDMSASIEALAALDVADFYLPFHQAVFSAIVDLEREQKPVDEDFLKMRLQKDRKWDEDAFAEILAATPLSDTLSYIEVLKEKRQNRELQHLSAGIKNAIEKQEQPAQIIQTASKTLDNIATSGMKEDPSIADIVQAFETDMSETVERGDIIGHRSGIKSLDRIVGAFSPGDLVVIGARPSMGKTVLATTIADNALSNGVGVIFDSLEMPSVKLFRRLVAKHSGETLNDLKYGRLKNYDRYRASLAHFKNLKNFYLQDESYIPIEKLKAKAIKILRHDKSVGFWIIDHLRYIKKKGIKTHEEVGEITKEFKKIGKEYGVVVVLLSQINREVNNRQNNKPQLSDLRDSGAIEEDADIVIMPHRDAYYKRGDVGREDAVTQAELIVAKNRDGAVGTAKTLFYSEYSKFEDGEIGYEVHYEPSEGGARPKMELPPI